MEIVSSHVENRIGVVTLNRPEKRNALSPELIAKLTDIIQDMNSAVEIKSILLKSSGDVFCAGADLGYLQELRNYSFDENKADTVRLKVLFETLYNSPKITIAQVEGPALAGGCGLATLCDFCFATPQASFGYTESKIGFVPALVMIYLKQKISGKDAKELLLTGKIINAESAKDIGLIHGIFEPQTISQEIIQFATQLNNTTAGESIQYIKEMWRQTANMTMTESLEYACEINAKARASADCIRGIDAFLNKEKISW